MGLGKYFNSETFTGRANVAKATYASFALLYVVYRIRRASKNDPPEETPQQLQEPSDACGACLRQCMPYCTPVQPPQPEPAVPPSSDPKLNIPEDPLFKQHQKKCECNIPDDQEDDDDEC